MNLFKFFSFFKKKKPDQMIEYLKNKKTLGKVAKAQAEIQRLRSQK